MSYLIVLVLLCVSILALTTYLFTYKNEQINKFCFTNEIKQTETKPQISDISNDDIDMDKVSDNKEVVKLMRLHKELEDVINNLDNRAFERYELLMYRKRKS